MLVERYSGKGRGTVRKSGPVSFVSYLYMPGLDPKYVNGETGECLSKH